MVKLAMYRYQYEVYHPKAMIVDEEYSYTSSFLTEYCHRLGVEHIDISDDCTVCSCDRFWSHRATGGERGSQGAVIVCQEVTG